MGFQSIRPRGEADRCGLVQRHSAAVVALPATCVSW